MAKIFFKIKENFTISNLTEDDMDDPVGPVSQQFKEKNPQLLDITLMLEDGRKVSFMPYDVSFGHFKIQLIDEKIEVDCDAIFKIDAKSDYIDDLLKPGGKWECSGLEGIFGEISGLKQETYKYKNRNGEGEAVRHLINVKVAKSEKELK